MGKYLLYMTALLLISCKATKKQDPCERFIGSWSSFDSKSNFNFMMSITSNGQNYLVTVSYPPALVENPNRTSVATCQNGVLTFVDGVEDPLTYIKNGDYLQGNDIRWQRRQK